MTQGIQDVVKKEVPMYVGDRLINVEDNVAQNMGRGEISYDQFRSISPDEVVFRGGDIGNMVKQGINPSDFKVPKYRLTAEYALTQLNTLNIISPLLFDTIQVYNPTDN